MTVGYKLDQMITIIATAISDVVSMFEQIKTFPARYAITGFQILFSRYLLVKSARGSCFQVTRLSIYFHHPFSEVYQLFHPLL